MECTFFWKVYYFLNFTWILKSSPVIENIQIPKYFYFLVKNCYHLISVSKYKFQTLSLSHKHTHTYIPGERWRERYMYIEHSHIETIQYTLWMSNKFDMLILIAFPSIVIQDENFCVYFSLLQSLLRIYSFAHHVLPWYDTKVLYFWEIDKWSFRSGWKGKEYPTE